MAHKTLINGTAYEVSGGKTLVNGTAYEVKNGKTLVNGTSYDISFIPMVTISASMSNYEKCVINGTTYNSSTLGMGGSVELELPIGTIITCEIKGTAMNTKTSTITVDGVVVVEIPKNTVDTKSYNYIVNGDTTIKMNGSIYGGSIIITTN